MPPFCDPASLVELGDARDVHVRLIWIAGHFHTEPLEAFGDSHRAAEDGEDVHLQLVSKIDVSDYAVAMKWMTAVLLLLAVGCTREPPPIPEGYASPPEVSSPVETEQISVIGDSYTSGTRMGGRASAGWPALTEKHLGKQGIATNIKVGAEGGSGYVARGEHGLTFADEIPKVVAPKDDLVVVLGSSNDGRNIPLDVLRPAVQSTLAQVQSAAPEARLLVVGPFYTAADAPPELLAVRDTVRDQAVAVGAQFVDPIGEGWFVDRPDLISTDGAHPTDEGHAYLAEKIAPLIAAQLPPPT